LKILAFVLLGLLAVAATLSATGKLRKDPKVIGMMTHVGVKESQIPLLAYLELLGAIGLLVGLKFHGLGIAAATGLALYFLGAVVAHLRTKDKVADLAPALFLALVSAATAYLISSQLG